MGLAGSTVVAILRGGDKRLGVTLSVKGIDTTAHAALLAETYASEFEALRPA
jgi:hypothetical protein